MTRDEILAKSRLDNMGEDEREYQISLKACSISRAVGFFICALAAFLEAILTDNQQIVSLSAWMIYSSMYSVEDWINAIKLQNKLKLAGAIVYSVLFVSLFVFFILELI